MKKMLVVSLGLLVVLCFSCNRDESLKKSVTFQECYEPSTLSFGKIEFVLDQQRTDLEMHVEVISDIADDACVLISLSDGSRKDSITYLLKGYKGYSIDKYSIRSYASWPFDFDVQYADSVKNHHIYLKEDATSFDFPVYIKEICLKKGKNIEKINIHFEQPLEYGINDPIVALRILRINDQIETQIENYPWKYRPSATDKIAYDQYFKSFPDSSISSFVFSNSNLLKEMSMLTEGECVPVEGWSTEEYCNYTVCWSGYRVFTQLSAQNSWDNSILHNKP
ncbi:MAG: hypothetical protein LBV41_03565 [Cytophagaceae bacterium]|jgi:hypothetical protein|nr:hypothetical protein [Cytophagaceae bacterium]